MKSLSITAHVQFSYSNVHDGALLCCSNIFCSELQLSFRVLSLQLHCLSVLVMAHVRFSYSGFSAVLLEYLSSWNICRPTYSSSTQLSMITMCYAARMFKSHRAAEILRVREREREREHRTLDPASA